MIFTALLVAAAAVVTAGVIAAFWEDIKSWLNNLIEKAKRVVKAAVVGVKVFGKALKQGFQEMAKSYQEDEKGKWHETTVTRTVSESDVPPEILAKAKRMNNQEVDISAELERELKLVL